MFELREAERLVAKIRVIGVGGGGGNAINSMIAANLFGVEFIAVNTDIQHLEASLAPVKVQIGANLTKGLGAGSNPVIGREAAIEDRDALLGCIEGADMLFITAGMGGGTGTGAAPVIASLARELGILTVGVVTRPFFYEGRKRTINAEDGIRDLKRHVDTLIVIPNDRISQAVEKDTPILKAFARANEVLKQAVQGISDLILIPGLINLDFADVKSIMHDSGRAVIGTGTGKSEGGASEAAKKAIANPLIEESSIEGTKGILINITGGLNLSIDSVQEVASLIHDFAHDDANIILGAVINPDMADDIRVTVIATGFEERPERAELPQLKKWAPSKEPISLRGSEKILSKRMDSSFEMPFVDSSRSEESGDTGISKVAEDSEVERKTDNSIKETTDGAGFDLNKQKAELEDKEILNNSLFPIEDDYDIPTFLRRKKIR